MEQVFVDSQIALHLHDGRAAIPYQFYRLDVAGLFRWSSTFSSRETVH